MGITVSYKTPDRNGPCPCGSGKKYKKCCYLKQGDNGYSPTEKERLLGRLNRLIDMYPGYDKWFKRVIAPRIESAQTQGLATQEIINMIVESAYFEGKIGSAKIADLAITKLNKQDPDKSELSELVKQSHYEWLEVRGVILGVKIMATSLWSGEDIVIYEQSGTYETRKGMLMATRLIPCKDAWQMTGHASYLPDQMAYKFKRSKKLGVNPLPLLQMDHIDAMIGYGEEKMLKDELEEEVKNANAQIDPKLRPGPEEISLTTQMMTEASGLDLPPVKRVRDEMIQTFCEQWLDKPQQELARMTPRQKILDERKIRGNPEKRIKYQVETRYYGDLRDELYNEGLWHQKQGRFLEAMGYYAQVVDYATKIEDSHRYYCNVASGLAYLACYAEAKVLFKKALTIDPTYEVAARNLASINNEQILAMEMPRNIHYLWQVTWKKWKKLPLPQNNKTEQVRDGLMWYLDLVSAKEITLKPKSGDLSVRAIKRIGDGLRIETGLPVAPHLIVMLGESLGLTHNDTGIHLVQLTKKGEMWKKRDVDQWVEVITTWLSTYVPTGVGDDTNLINPVAHVLPWLAAKPEKRSWSLDELEQILKVVYKMKKEERMVNVHAILLPEMSAFGIVELGEKLKEITVTDYGRELLAAMLTEAKRQIPREIWELL